MHGKNSNMRASSLERNVSQFDVHSQGSKLARKFEARVEIGEKRNFFDALMTRSRNCISRLNGPAGKFTRIHRNSRRIIISFRTNFRDRL